MAENVNLNVNTKFNIIVGQKGAEKVGKDMEKLKEKTSWFSRFRGEWLSVMFAGQRLAQITGQMLAPAQEILGTQELWSNAMLELTLPAMEDQVDALENWLDAVDDMDEGTKNAIGSLIIWGNQLGTAMDFIGSTAMAVWGLGKIWMWFAGSSLGSQFLLDIATIKTAILTWWQNLPAALTALKEGFVNFATKLGGWIKGGLEGIASWFGALPGWAIVGMSIAAAIGTAFLGYFLGNWLISMWAKAIGVPLARILIGVVGAVLIAGAVALAIATGWTGIGAVAAAAMAGAGAGLIAAAATYSPEGLQHGGLVTHPTNAIIGERGPEAVIPLDKAGLGGVYNVTLNVEVNSRLDPNEVPSLARELASQFGDEVRRMNTERVTF